MNQAPDRLARLPINLLLVTNTVPPSRVRTLPYRVRSVAPLLAEAIALLHSGEPLNTLLMRA
ncbi:hypothetical protein TR51_10360 [Kitasatospora griseola]|uniref:Uncharacterized protein n=1 Tax=Kitasatospora griseola TaxID=2064 RepID=A0A0D0PQ30_KITGR|nr:hypothetical protein TR51_10360 [Kitasatospora griseola]